VDFDDGRKVIVGVVSFGAASGCTLGYPAVFSRVTSHLEWIHKFIGNSVEDNTKRIINVDTTTPDYAVQLMVNFKILLFLIACVLYMK
jgi:secreted trypsin-like serine protease